MALATNSHTKAKNADVVTYRTVYRFWKQWWAISIWLKIWSVRDYNFSIQSGGQNDRKFHFLKSDCDQADGLSFSSFSFSSVDLTEWSWAQSVKEAVLILQEQALVRSTCSNPLSDWGEAKGAPQTLKDTTAVICPIIYRENSILGWIWCGLFPTAKQCYRSVLRLCICASTR